MRLRTRPSNEDICGKPQTWYAWRPVRCLRSWVWLEHVERTRWHSGMGHWYWAYREIEQ